MKDRITITDVTPRDGLQSLKKMISTEDKVKLIKLLRKAGCPEVEMTSFVHPRKVPQFVDAEDILSTFSSDASFYVLIPNKKGLERALLQGVKSINILSSVSETFSRKNLGKSIDEHIDELRKVIELAQRSNLKIRASMSMAFYCPDEKEVSLERLERQVDFFLSSGCQEIVLCDTCSAINSERLNRSLSIFSNFNNVGLHLHAQGGKENIYMKEALGLGIRHFETGLKESGGCPFNEGSQYNSSTEELVKIAEELGFSTGIDLELLNDAQCFFRGLL